MDEKINEVEGSSVVPAKFRKSSKSPYFNDYDSPARKRKKTKKWHVKKRSPKKRKLLKKQQKTSPYFTATDTEKQSSVDDKSIVNGKCEDSHTVAGIIGDVEADGDNLYEEEKNEEGRKALSSPATRGLASSTMDSSVKRHRHLLYPDFSPPVSPFGLVQEQLFKEPWKLLVATIFLNKTTGLAAKPILWEFLRLYPTPEATIEACPKALTQLFQPLGLHHKRAAGIIRLSEEYVQKNWEYPIELYGIGKYGNDSYRIFCTPEWREVRPSDHWLNKYYAWLCDQNNFQPEGWSP